MSAFDFVDANASELPFPLGTRDMLPQGEEKNVVYLVGKDEEFEWQEEPPDFGVDYRAADLSRLGQNKIHDWITDVDIRLTPGLTQLDNSWRPTLHRRQRDGTWSHVARAPAEAQRVLLLVHGTFSNRATIVAEIEAGFGAHLPPRALEEFYGGYACVSG